MTNGSLARLNDLEVRLYRLVTRSHLRIGAGDGTADISAADNPIIRALVYKEGEERRVPYLPGSSLHGVIRAWVEKALRSSRQPVDAQVIHNQLQDNAGFAAAVRKELGAFLGSAVDAEVTDAVVLDNWQAYADVCNPLSLTDQCERIYQRDLETRAWKLKYYGALGRETPCKVCDIFGYVGQRGRVKVTNAFPSAEHGDNIPVDVITRVAINRLTGAADEGKLFDMEAIPPGVSFYFFVVMENMSDGQKAAFDKGIRAMSLQLAGLGAHSTIGFGMVDVAQVLGAKIQTSMFDRRLEEELPALLADTTLQTPLDAEKYPDFFKVLAALKDAGQKSAFEGGVTFV